MIKIEVEFLSKGYNIIEEYIKNNNLKLNKDFKSYYVNDRDYVIVKYYLMFDFKNKFHENVLRILLL